MPKLAAPVSFDAQDHALLGQVVDYYHETLKQSAEGLDYLRDRGLDHPELVERFRLGLADRTLGLRLPEKNRKAGIKLYWDGWPDVSYPRFLPVKYGDKTLPMMIEYERHGPAINAEIFNVNGFWVTDALKQADHVELGPDTGIAPRKLPTGSLYQIGLALEGC